MSSIGSLVNITKLGHMCLKFLLYNQSALVINLFVCLEIDLIDSELILTTCVMLLEFLNIAVS